MRLLRLFFIGLACAFFLGCSKNRLDYYSQRKPKINLYSFFQGEVEGWGAIFDFRGRQIRSFVVTIQGAVQESTLTLDENFVFDDGEITQRRWDIQFDGEHHYVAKAGDVIGEAKGIYKGNTANLRYTLEIPYKNSTLQLSMDDWMYGVTDDIILNRTTMNKFCLPVGEIVLFMKKKS